MKSEKALKQTYVIPESKSFAIFFHNPTDSARMGEFVFFRGKEDFSEVLEEIFHTCNPDRDFVEFKSQLKKLLISANVMIPPDIPVSKLEEVLNLYKAIQFFGPTMNLSSSEDDFSIDLRRIFWSDLYDDERSQLIPANKEEDFFNWIYTYPYG